jgi:tetratricopeptide (TPR) repeat protein
MDTGPKVFISYRRDDGAGHAGRLADDLRERFGREQVFFDLVSIVPGADFPEKIKSALAECRALLAVIGPRWLTLQDEGGRRRLDLENDYLRLEIATALAQNLLVIPMLVQGAKIPNREYLPEPLQALADKNAYELSDSHWDQDVARLVSVLQEQAGLQPLALAKPGEIPKSESKFAELPVLKNGDLKPFDQKFFKNFKSNNDRIKENQIYFIFIIGLMIIAAGLWVFSESKTIEKIYKLTDSGRAYKKKRERDNLINQGKDFYNKYEYFTAKLSFNKALQIDPNFASGLLWLAKTNLELREFSEAYKSLQKALKNDPNLVEVHVIIGRIYLMQRMVPEAEKKLKEAQQLDPQNVDALLLKAALAIERRNLEEAKVSITKAKSIDPKKFDIYFIEGKLENFQTQNLKVVELIYDKAIKALPDKMEPYLARARLADGQRKFTEGEKFLKEAEKLWPKNAIIQTELANHYRFVFQFDQAEQHLRQAYGLETENESRVVDLANFLLGKNKSLEAAQELMNFIVKHPDTTEARFALAGIYSLWRQKDNALKILQEIVTKDPFGPIGLRAKNAIAEINAGH